MAQWPYATLHPLPRLNRILMPMKPHAHANNCILLSVCTLWSHSNTADETVQLVFVSSFKAE